MRLTKNQAIKRHRNMWNYIADKIEKAEHVLDIDCLKIEYLESKGIQYILNHCFLCAYAMGKGGCDVCPLEPNNATGGCLGGLYFDCKNAETWTEQAALARQIVNLPEREEK